MITAAIIGCGKAKPGKEGFAIAHNHADGWQQSGCDVTLAAVDIDQTNLDAFAVKFGVARDHCFTSTETLYKALSPDVVSICTWPALHGPQVIEAANAGAKVIVCEKPLALDRNEIDQLTAVCRNKGAHLMVAHQRRYEAQFEKARELITSGALGSSVVGEARVSDGWDMLSWTVHWFDMASFLFDDQPAKIIAGIDHTNSRRYQHAIEDASVVFAEYTKGHQAIFITGPSNPLGQGWRIAGPEGELRFIENGNLLMMKRDGTEVIEVNAHPQSAFARLLADAAAVAEGNINETRCDATHGSVGTEMAYAAHESARTCRAIDPRKQRTRFAPLEAVQHAPVPRPLVPGAPGIPEVPGVPGPGVNRAVLLGDPHHYDAALDLSGRDGLQDALAAAVAKEVDLVCADQRELTEEDLADCDLLVIYHTVRKATSEHTRRLLTRYVESGRPLLVTHCGIGAYADWPQFRQWIGRYWVWGDEDLPASGHPHVPCYIKSSPQLGVPWSEAWLPRDEVYINLADAGAIDVLARMTTGDIDDPAIWRSSARPNVIVTLPGHRADIWDLPAMRDQLRAASALLLNPTACRQ